MTPPNSASQQASPGQLVEVKSEFHVKAQRPGGVKREVGLQKAEATLISAHAEIRRELDTAFNSVILLADGLQCMPHPNNADIVRLRKSAREMRDVGTLAHYPLVTLIGTMMVDVLNRQIDGEIEHRPEVLSCLTDALVLVKSQALRDAGVADVPEMMTNLKKMMATIVTPKSPPTQR